MGLVERAAAGDRRALARLTTVLERGDHSSDAAVAALPSVARPPHVIGITGPPGAGKSSIVSRLVDALLARGESVAVLMIDPSSPFTGGAVLGDRIRLDEWADDRIFVRSMASRGWEGGLAPGVAYMLRLFGAAGFDRVIVESVGVGQDAVDIRELADTVMVVQVPNLGDAVQSLKAGILEIADVYVVNKADLPGSRTTVRELNALLRLVELDPSRFAPVVLPVSAKDATGFAAVMETLNRHRTWLAASTSGSSADRRRASWYLRKRLQSAVAGLARDSALDEIGADLMAGRIDSQEAVVRVSELLPGR